MTGATVASPSGTFTLSCPATALPPGTYEAQWLCTGGALTIQSYDGLTAVNGTLTSGVFTETASGGGKGGHTTYYYVFTGTFTGTITQSGQASAIFGATTQSLAGLTSPLGTGAIYSGSTSTNTTYEPVYIADTYNSRIVRVDDMFGDNWTSIGSPGTGAGHFNLPWGIVLDSAGKIYVTDSTNCRVVRMDDMTGKNWTSLGRCGSGSHQFSNPSGIFVDPAGNIYVADTGNNRIVRMSDMAGDQWIAYGSAGSGSGQFNAPSGIAVNAAGQIYIVDQVNARIVRIDNMAGANWTALGSYGSGVGQFDYPGTVSLDSTGRIYIADAINDRIVRMDDMSGANWTVLGGVLGAGVNQFVNPYGMYIDPFGTIYVADTHDNRVVMSDDMAASNWTAFGTCCLGAGAFNLPTGIYAAPVSTPTPVATLSAKSLSFGSAVVGTSTPSQTVTLTNIGSAPLEINSIVAGGDFPQTNTCPGSLPPSQNCVVTVTFTPVGTGTRTGTLTFNFGSGAKTVSLAGFGTLITVTPTALNFGDVQAGDNHASLTVTVSNPCVAAAGIASVVMNAPGVYRMTNQCGTTLAANTSCSVKVTFTPQAAKVYNGLLTVTDSAGMAHKVTITGTGTSN